MQFWEFQPDKIEFGPKRLQHMSQYSTAYLGDKCRK